MKWTPKVLEALKQIQFSYVYKSIMIKIVCSSMLFWYIKTGWKGGNVGNLQIHYLVELNFKFVSVIWSLLNIFSPHKYNFSQTQTSKNTQLILIAFLLRLFIVFPFFLCHCCLPITRTPSLLEDTTIISFFLACCYILCTKRRR